MITISDKGKAIAALCAEKDVLQAKADALNTRMNLIIREHAQTLLEISAGQKDILVKMAECDTTIERISRTIHD